MTIDPVILYPILAVVTAYMGFLEVRWQRSSEERHSMHTRIALLESNICTSDDVRTIVRDENRCVSESLDKLSGKVDKLADLTSQMQLAMATRRADDEKHED